MPIHQHLLDWHKAFSAKDPAVDLPVDWEEDHPEEEQPLHPCPLGVVVEVVEVVVAEEDSHLWAHQVLLEVEENEVETRQMNLMEITLEQMIS